MFLFVLTFTTSLLCSFLVSHFFPGTTLRPRKAYRITDWVEEADMVGELQSRSDYNLVCTVSQMNVLSTYVRRLYLRRRNECVCVLSCGSLCLAWRGRRRGKREGVCVSQASHRPKSGQSNYASNERKNWGEVKCAHYGAKKCT